MSVRGQVGRALRAVGLRSKPTPPWVVAEAAPNPSNPLADVPLFAIIGVWMEADVIAATVSNAFAQGCSRVYLVDNDSADETVSRAVEAGAVFAESFATERYDEQLRLDIMNRVVRDVSLDTGAEHIWWLWLDADEFPHGPGGKTVAEYLATLDRRFRVVGARFINHFPDRAPAYVEGLHPLDFQPLCEEHRLAMCSLRHRKHPLQRFDRSGPPIICDRGFHAATSTERPLREPNEAIFVHHFPYREFEVTRRRLAMLCGADPNGETRVFDDDDAADAMLSRFETLDAVYRQDWERVRNYHIDSDISSARPVPWDTLVPPADTPVKRWYPVESIDQGGRA